MKVYWGMGHLEKNKFEITSLKGKWIPRKQKVDERITDHGDYFVEEDVYEDAWETKCTYIAYVKSPFSYKDKPLYMKMDEPFDGYLVCNNEEKKEMDKKFRKRWFFESFFELFEES